MLKGISMFVMVLIAGVAFAAGTGKTSKTTTTTTATTGTTDAETALKAQIPQFNEAWNKGDAKTLASFWAEDGTLIDPAGKEGRGRAEVEKIIASDLGGPMKGVQSNLSCDKYHAINETTVVADCTHELSGGKTPDGKAMPTMKAHVTAVAVKKDNKWLWSDVRPYFFAPMPGAPGMPGMHHHM